MDYRAFEQRLLDTIFTTDVQITPATIAYLYKIQVTEAEELLRQAAVSGLLNIESDDEGNVLYTYPNRIKLPQRPQASGRSESAGTGPAASVSIIRHDALGEELSRRGVAVMTFEPAVPAPRSRPPFAGAEPRGAPSLEDTADYDRLPSIQMDALPDPPRPSRAAETSASGEPGVARCPFCNETIVAGAKKCKHCHEYLDYALRDLHVQRGVNQVSVALQHIPQQQTAITQWTGTQAALLSLFMPGLGQMCSGRVPSGLLWMMFTIMGYLCLIVPGFILHVLCVINASRIPRQNS